MLQIGRKAIIETAHECGLKSNLLSIASLPLGTNEVTLLDITTGYATFANSGKLAMPHTLLEIRRPTGELLYSREANAAPPKQVEPLDKIADLNTMMNQVVVAGTGQRAFPRRYSLRSSCLNHDTPRTSMFSVATSYSRSGT